jgi:type III secretory pathway component EscR
MMASVILVVSLVTLLMFFVSYCRSLMASSVRHTLSREVRDVTGIPASAASTDFARVMQLLHLCPERPEDRTGLQAVGLYYNILSLVEKTIARVLPSLHQWAEQERAGCANFAVVLLDRRIAFSREILAQQGEF